MSPPRRPKSSVMRVFGHGEKKHNFRVNRVVAKRKTVDFDDRNGIY